VPQRQCWGIRTAERPPISTPQVAAVVDLTKGPQPDAILLHDMRKLSASARRLAGSSVSVARGQTFIGGNVNSRWLQARDLDLFWAFRS
jgi:hypothetical protein